MKQITIQELETLINEYTSSKPIKEPLFVYGESHLDGRVKTVKRILGDDNWWKITYDDDAPSSKFAYCIYNIYIGGEDYSDAVLRNTIQIAEKVNIPVFCFIDNSEYEKVPTDIVSKYIAYQLI